MILVKTVLYHAALRKSGRCFLTYDLKLINLEAKARGSERAIYFHPDYPDIVFKIVVGKEIDLRSGKFEHIALKAFPNKLMMRRSRKELQSYLLSKFDYHVSDVIYPAAEMRGFYESDLGLAVAFERVTDGSNALGPTLAQISEAGQLTAHHIDLLNEFAQRLLAWNLIASDLNLSNIVLGQRGGISQFVLVDGMGAPHLIPLRYWSRRFNRRELVSSMRKIARRVNGMHDAMALRFSDLNQRFEIITEGVRDGPNHGKT